MYSQVYSYIQQYLNPLLCRLQQGHGTQHAYFRLLQVWQKDLDESGYNGTVLMDLLKAYDCLPHDLIIAKFEAYGRHNISLKLFHSYFSNRKQIVNIGSAISEQIHILTGIPQGFNFGPFIFNNFISNRITFIEKSDIYNFVDDNTLYKSSPSLLVVLNCLKYDITIVLNWFKVNSLKNNPKNFSLWFQAEEKASNVSGKFMRPIYIQR